MHEARCSTPAAVARAPRHPSPVNYALHAPTPLPPFKQSGGRSRKRAAVTHTSCCRFDPAAPPFPNSTGTPSIRRRCLYWQAFSLALAHFSFPSSFPSVLPVTRTPRNSRRPSAERKGTHRAEPRPLGLLDINLRPSRPAPPQKLSIGYLAAGRRCAGQLRHGGVVRSCDAQDERTTYLWTRTSGSMCLVLRADASWTRQ